MTTELIQKHIKQISRPSTTQSTRNRCPRLRRRGFTLVEMMVSVTLALLMILAVVQVFEWMGDSVAYGRATIEMSGELQTASTQLQHDLDNRTCDVKPWIKPGEGAGYFFYREIDPVRAAAENFVVARSSGDIPLSSDSSSLSNGTDPNIDLDPNRQNFFFANSHFGDLDDVIAFTVRSTGKPFSGVDGAGNFVESSLAEVTYLVHNSGTSAAPLINLYRSVRLILPAAADPTNGIVPGGDIATALNPNDLSLPGVPLSLESVTQLENRFYSRLNNTTSVSRSTVAEIAFSQLTAPSNLILQDVLAFDVRAYDPTAPIFNIDGVALAPGDPGYTTGGTAIGQGAFVDLGYAALNGLSALSGPPNSLSPPMIPETSVPDVAYNTLPWSLLMLAPGGGVGAAVDGLDSANIVPNIDPKNPPSIGPPANGIDDIGERPIRAPYHMTLRGIEVTLRMWEVQTGQVMQSSVVGDFVPK